MSQSIDIATVIRDDVRANLTIIGLEWLPLVNRGLVGGKQPATKMLAEAVDRRADFQGAARAAGWTIADSGLQFINEKDLDENDQAKTFGELTEGVATDLDWADLCLHADLEAPTVACEAYAVSDRLAGALRQLKEPVMTTNNGLTVWSRVIRTTDLAKDPVLLQATAMLNRRAQVMGSTVTEDKSYEEFRAKVVAIMKDGPAGTSRKEVLKQILLGLVAAKPILERLEKDVRRWDKATELRGIATLNALRDIEERAFAEQTAREAAGFSDKLLERAFAEARRLHPVITDVLGRDPTLWDIARSTEEHNLLSELLRQVHKVQSGTLTNT